jgi:hypothetical protein
LENKDIAEIETEVLAVCEKLDIDIVDDEEKDGQKGSSNSSPESG